MTGSPGLLSEHLVAPVAVLALALTACVGGGDKADAKSPDTGKAKVFPSPEPSSGGDMDSGESATGKVAEDPGEVTYEVVAQKVDWAPRRRRPRPSRSRTRSRARCWPSPT
ncbi:hypothetical protein [Streptomyces sp. NPDC050416]|uniref:hypothetical protein n=1 Tax=Streptomyces sp. NPDC050416 TaxID=3365611 RepID=UPI0037A70508